MKKQKNRAKVCKALCKNFKKLGKSGKAKKISHRSRWNGFLKISQKPSELKQKNGWNQPMRALTHPAHLLSARKNVIKGKIAKNGHFKEIFESFRFFEKKKFTTFLILAL